MDIENAQEVFQRQEQLSHRLKDMLSGTSYDLIVQRAAGTNVSTRTPPEEFAGTLLGVPGVKLIQPGILNYTQVDFFDLEEPNERGVLVVGWWPNRCPLFARFNFPSDSRPLKVGERYAAIVGESLARKLGKRMGDTIAIKGSQKFRIVGIYKSPLEFENNGLVVPVQDLQTVLGLTREVTAFVISAERPIDEIGLEELRQRIEAIQPGLEVTRVERQNSDVTPPARSK